MTKLAAYSIARHRRADGTRDHETGSRRTGRGFGRNAKMDDQCGCAGADPAPDSGGELGAAAQARRGGQHGVRA